MGIPNLLCPKCRDDLEKRSDEYICNRCGATFPILEGVISLFDYNMDPNCFSGQEAMAHDESAAFSEEFMGLGLYYNQKLHTSIHDQISKFLSPGQNVLELGSGVGRDIVAIAGRHFSNLHASDVSLKSIQQAKKWAERNKLDQQINFYHFDGSHSLPFKEKEFDAVIMVAALHHFNLVVDALKEIKRCCKPGGYIMAFIEPNCSYYRFIRPIAKAIETCLSPLRHTPHMKRSIAEETADGFSIPLIYDLATKTGLEVVTVQSHWILTGLIYLLQQCFFRIQGKNHPTLLNALSKMTCRIDDWLTRRATLFCWHYSFIFRT